MAINRLIMVFLLHAHKNKSTGARTPEGKAVSSRNAHKGGIRSICREMNTLFRDYKDMLKRFD
jgi:hypothetical protein